MNGVLLLGGLAMRQPVGKALVALPPPAIAIGVLAAAEVSHRGQRISFGPADGARR
ncbi:MAG: hypothetical protein K2X49_15215 [Acetobacteraceae bacterium]|nr:hypothetical protein [Acetobacteraceae bacterium]